MYRDDKRFEFFGCLLRVQSHRGTRMSSHSAESSATQGWTFQTCHADSVAEMDGPMDVVEDVHRLFGIDDNI